MSSPTLHPPGRPVGPPRSRGLAQRVFWFRRALVLALAVLLVVLVARLLSWAGGPEAGAAPQQGDVAARVAADAESGIGSYVAGTKNGRIGGVFATTPAVTQGERTTPTAECDPAGVVAKASISDAHAGAPVSIRLSLTTQDQACRWRIAPGEVYVRINLAGETLWSTQQCPGAVPSAELDLRPKRAVEVVLGWSGRTSDATCSVGTAWVHPGVYRVFSVADGALQPHVSGFLLQEPKTRIITRTITPSPTPSPSRVDPSEPAQKSTKKPRQANSEG